MSITFYGTVKDDQGKPIARARIVHACGRECPFKAPADLSDVNGMYLIRFDGGSFHMLTCSKAGYESQTETHGARGARKVRCDFTLTKKVRAKKTTPRTRPAPKPARKTKAVKPRGKTDRVTEPARRKTVSVRAVAGTDKQGTPTRERSIPGKKSDSNRTASKPRLKVHLHISNAVQCGAPCKTKEGPCERLTFSRPCWQHGGGEELAAGIKKRRTSIPISIGSLGTLPGRPSRPSAEAPGAANVSRRRGGLRRAAQHRRHPGKPPPARSAHRESKPVAERQPARSAGKGSGFDQVEFTAIHPEKGMVEERHTLLVYAHLESALQEVMEDAQRFKDQLFPPRIVQPSFHAQIQPGEKITIVPRAKGVTFQPKQITLEWMESYHRAEFHYRASKALADDAAHGDITLYVGPLIVGVIKFAMLCGTADPASSALHKEIIRMYKQDEMFFSYSHADSAIVKGYGEYARTLFKVLIDFDTLQSGDQWSAELERMIKRARIFQLFWSSNSCQSKFVEQEWRYALSLDRPDGFIRPVYWEKPMPTPPTELSHIHFQHMQVSAPREWIK